MPSIRSLLFNWSSSNLRHGQLWTSIQFPVALPSSPFSQAILAFQHIEITRHWVPTAYIFLLYVCLPKFLPLFPGFKPLIITKVGKSKLVPAITPSIHQPIHPLLPRGFGPSKRVGFFNIKTFKFHHFLCETPSNLIFYRWNPFKPHVFDWWNPGFLKQRCLSIEKQKWPNNWRDIYIYTV